VPSPAKVTKRRRPAHGKALDTLAGAGQGPLPAFVKPSLALLVDKPGRIRLDQGTLPCIQLFLFDAPQNGGATMSSPRPTDLLTDRVREPDELRRLNLELDSAGTTMWPWMIGLLAAIIVAMLVYDYERPILTTAATPAKVNPPTATPSSAPVIPAPATQPTPHQN
jgi:hypothetical protein